MGARPCRRPLPAAPRRRRRARARGGARHARRRRAAGRRAPRAPRWRERSVARDARRGRDGDRPSRRRSPTTRVTIIDPVSLSAEHQARAWLAELDRDREVSAATAVLNRVLHSHRIASADPYIHEVSPAQALVIRAGWGEGEQVADGRWLHARELPWPAGDRAQRGRAARRARDRSRRCARRSASRRCSARAAQRCCARSSRCVRAWTSTTARLAHAAIELDGRYAAALSPSCAPRAGRIWRSGSPSSSSCGRRAAQAQAASRARRAPGSRARHRCSTTRSDAWRRRSRAPHGSTRARSLALRARTRRAGSNLE